MGRRLQSLEKLENHTTLEVVGKYFKLITVEPVSSPNFGRHQILDYWEVLDYSVSLLFDGLVLNI